MTKSKVLVIADDPERTITRHTEGCYETFEDVTAAFRRQMHQIARAPTPEGLNPAPEFQLALAVKKTAQQFFDHDYVVHEHGSSELETVLKNHVVLREGHLHAAYRGVPPQGHAKDGRVQPFDYWLGAHIRYLPLRDATDVAPYHPETEPSDENTYYAGIPSTNYATIGDVDLGQIARARLETQADLVASATQVLRVWGGSTAFDWSARYDAAGHENPAYFDQDKPRVLHKALPEHAKRIDFLLLDAAQIDLFLRWGMIPVHYLITDHGGLVADYCVQSPEDAQFERITQCNARLLRAIRDAWTAADADMQVSVFTGQE